MTEFKSLTMRLEGRDLYQITLWPDGLCRLDGTRGPRLGAWVGSAPSGLATLLEPLLGELPDPPRKPVPSEALLVVEGAEGSRRTYAASPTSRNAQAWRTSMALAGVAATIPWSPLDLRAGFDWRPWSDATSVSMTQAGVYASALARNEGIVVLAGSVASTVTSPTLEATYRKAREELSDQGVWHLTEDSFMLNEHICFSTPSAASSVLAGSNTNGKQAWRDARGRRWAALDLG